MLPNTLFYVPYNTKTDFIVTHSYTKAKTRCFQITMRANIIQRVSVRFSMYNIRDMSEIKMEEGKCFVNVY